MKKLFITMCAFIGLLFTGSAAALQKDTMLKASYFQLDAPGSIPFVTESGIKASNIIIFGFADPETSSINQEHLKIMQDVINKGAPNTKNFLSLGGETVTSIPDSNTVINNIDLQIEAYNAQLRNGQIHGVDLDLENGIDSKTITDLAKGFKNAGHLISIAPQVYASGGQGDSIDINNPINLVLTSGHDLAQKNTYGDAVTSGYVDYIMLQTYNTGGFTIGGYEENEIGFFKAVAEAMNNAAASQYLDIPATTKILIGQLSNRGAGGQYTIFNPTAEFPFPDRDYNQADILNELAADIEIMQADNTNFGKIAGVMVWSLNNDYMPQGWNDTYATAGAFSTIIFGAEAPPVGQYFIMQVTNTGKQKNASVTLVVDGNFYPFGQVNDTTLPSNFYQQWGTLASSQEQEDVANSSSLDAIFSNGVTSVKATIIGNSYDNWETPISNPDEQTQGTDFTFEAGHSYNVMVNPDTMAIEAVQMN